MHAMFLGGNFDDSSEDINNKKMECPNLDLGTVPTDGIPFSSEN